MREVRRYKQAAYAETTKTAYKCHLKSFMSFCVAFSCTPIPASQHTIVAYATYLARRLVPSSIPVYLNVIRLLHLEAGFNNPLTENWELGLVKRGISRTHGRPPLQKQPITIDMLHRMAAAIPTRSPADHAFFAATLIGFFGFFRKSTLLPAPGPLMAGKFIARNDIINLTLESFELVSRFSKVIQFGQRIHVVPFVRNPDVSLCPVRALLAHRGASPLGSNRPLFNYVRDGREISMTQTAYVSRLRALLKSIGYDTTLYSAHSLRRGGASYAFQVGLSHIQIKSRGDWSSNAFERYVHINSEAAMQAARTIAANTQVAR
jgi:integrase